MENGSQLKRHQKTGFVMGKIESPPRLPLHMLDKRIEYLVGNELPVSMRNVDPNLAQWYEETQPLYLTKCFFGWLFKKDYTRLKELDDLFPGY